jgi:hypothetical protein
MRCPHCNTLNFGLIPFSRAIDGGRAYAQVCTHCGHIIGLRPRFDSDPPAVPPILNTKQAARLAFVRWLLHDECEAQTGHGSHAA